LLEVSQIRRRLILLDRHEVAVCADEIFVIADRDVIVVFILAMARRPTVRARRKSLVVRSAFDSGLMARVGALHCRCNRIEFDDQPRRLLSSKCAAICQLLVAGWCRELKAVSCVDQGQAFFIEGVARMICDS
jgi:hypothetical protein